MKTFGRCVARLLIACLLGLGLPLPASAGIVTTGQIAAVAERDRIRNFLNRAEARAAARRAVEIGGPRLAQYEAALKAIAEGR